MPVINDPQAGSRMPQWLRAALAMPIGGALAGTMAPTGLVDPAKAALAGKTAMDFMTLGYKPWLAAIRKQLSEFGVADMPSTGNNTNSPDITANYFGGELPDPAGYEALQNTKRQQLLSRAVKPKRIWGK